MQQWQVELMVSCIIHGVVGNIDIRLIKSNKVVFGWIRLLNNNLVALVIEQEISGFVYQFSYIHYRYRVLFLINYIFFCFIENNRLKFGNWVRLLCIIM